MEVVIVPERRCRRRSGGGRARRCARHTSGAGARSGDGELAARRLPATDRGPRAGRVVVRPRQRRAARRVRRPAAPIIPRRIGRSSGASSSTTSTCRSSACSAPTSMPTISPTACRRYDQLIADLGGVDVQLLGIGSDGHIGFNEPGSSLASRTRIKTLTRATRADNARFFDDHEQAVPRHVVTQGLGTILEARHLLLVACGPGKAAADRARRRGPADGDVPGVGPAAAPARDGRRRRAGGGRARARRLLPRGVREQAAVAAAVNTLRSTFDPTDAVDRARARADGAARARRPVGVDEHRPAHADGDVRGRARATTRQLPRAGTAARPGARVRRGR